MYQGPDLAQILPRTPLTESETTAALRIEALAVPSRHNALTKRRLRPFSPRFKASSALYLDTNAPSGPDCAADVPGIGLGEAVKTPDCPVWPICCLLCDHSAINGRTVGRLRAKRSTRSCSEWSESELHAENRSQSRAEPIRNRYGVAIFK